MFKHIEVNYKDKIKIISLNRPEVYNALNTELMLELKQALLESNDNHEVNSVILNGKGKAFCSGADIKEFENQLDNNDAILKRAQLTKEIHSLIPDLQKTIIASVHNYVYAGGCGLALACDIVLAADDATFSYPETNRGFVPALVMPNLIRVAGRRKAFEMLITGRKIPTQEALDIGLINKIFSEDNLYDETLKIAEEIAEKNQDVLINTKKLFNSVESLPYDSAMEEAKNYNISMRQSESFQEGVKNFNK